MAASTTQPGSETQPPLRALITGANTGIGYDAARALASRGIKLTLACRSMDKAERARARILAESSAPPELVDVLELDLADLASVGDAASKFLERGEALDILINNAGLAGLRGETADGFELAFGVNHLGHFKWTLALMPALVQAKTPRIVHVASRAHERAPGIDFEAARAPTRSRTGFPEYQVSKLANVLFSAELARRLKASDARPDASKISSYSLHPGVVATDVWREVPGLLRGVMKLFMISSEQGAATTVYCATDPACAGQSGLYYDRCAPKTPSPLAQDPALASALWRRSSEWAEIDLTL